eukprot:TRINITY_DN410_c0_g1_i3.p1 TRINITY_DN410_c0_g1~~TRINITY_DN410_c0_g1_i3.p1  ORF type:complete len:102 (-),score=11.85 TRINITY_DN410_c0_g1_i3:495-800(-)
MYCSVSCRSESWREHHELLCSRSSVMSELKSLSSIVPFTTQMMLVRCLANVLLRVREGVDFWDAWRPFGMFHYILELEGVDFTENIRIIKSVFDNPSSMSF